MKKVLIIMAAIVLLSGCEKKEEEKKVECPEIAGGSFVLKYNTNGGKALEDVSVCIACSPDSYADIETPTRKGYKFNGWYLDEELKTAFAGETTLDVTPVKDVDENGCTVAYKDVTLYASWTKK